MITRQTVLVLGAGASHTYGFPLGSQLRTDILELGIGTKPFVVNSGLTDHPLLHEFIGAFKLSRLYSIDSFLGLNMRFAEVGKLAIAAVMMDYENRTFENLQSTSVGLYDYLWNRISGECSREELNFHSLSIVTFNYDRSLEAFLLSAIQGTFGMTEAEAIEKLTHLGLVHVYGALGSVYPSDTTYLPYGQGVNAGNVLKAVRGLKVIPEARDDEPTVITARELLLQAEKICFLGFGFDPLNLRRLNTSVTCYPARNPQQKSPVKRTIAASCFGRTRAEAASDAGACSISAGFIGNNGFPENFIEGDGLKTLRETLILG
jgi:hypothetical protein